jgi:uncharacterized Zn finger protein
MHTPREGFTCVECGGSLEQVHDVPVLQSLSGHIVHRCGDCGHILLVPQSATEWSLGWLNALDGGGAISCAALL